MAFLDHFGPGGGWLILLWVGASLTVAVSIAAFSLGAIIGAAAAFAKVAGGPVLRVAANTYTTIFRGIPDLLIIYLFYFGSSTWVTAIRGLFGAKGYVEMPAFLIGAAALAVVSGAYQTEVFRGAYGAIIKGEVEAGRAIGMSDRLLFFRVIVPQLGRYGLPGFANVWLLILKDSALISVTGLAELMRQSQVAAGSTREPFTYYLLAGFGYLVVTFVSNRLFKRYERHLWQHQRKGT
jgi:octopine/nopaline transport system permease protein